MPYFSVLVHASNLRIPPSDVAGPIAGFYTTRVVRAAQEADAGTKAMKQLTREWKSNPLAATSLAPNLQLSVEKVSPVPTLVGMFRRVRGYAFYREE